MSRAILTSSASDGEAYAGSESDVTPVTSAETSGPTPLSVGQQLSTAREARGMTVADVAKAIKLSLRQVEALEADDWPSLPCKTIIRGFVRNYARLMSLNSDLLMVELDSLTMPQDPELQMPTGPTVSIPREGKADRRDYVKVLSGLIILVLSVLAYFVVPQDFWQSTLSVLKSATQSHEVVAEKTASSESVGSNVPESAIAPPATTLLPDSSGTPHSKSQPASATVSAPVPMSGNGLNFSFTQPSWVEVRDRSGEIVFSQLCQAGSQREIEGQPPFALVIGNSEHVTLHYKGKVIDLSRRSKDGVTRLTVE